jgi:hypothetical protein
MPRPTDTPAPAFGWAYRAANTTARTNMHYYRSGVRYQLSLCRRVTYRGFLLHEQAPAPMCPECATRLENANV